MSNAVSSPFDSTIGSGPEAILLHLSEDAYLGDAEFTVSVDGQQIDGIQTAHVLHASGDTQSLNVLGNFGAGAHSVSVNFLNDAYDGSPTTDRNLYIDSIVADGVTIAGATLYSAGAQVFHLPGPVLVTDAASLNAAIDAAGGATSGHYAIAFANNIVETAALDAINLQPNVSLTIDGRGYTLDGANSYRGLFAYAGTVTVQNLSIDNTIAQGGRGGGEGAGGGAGLGGGLFVAGTNAGLSSGASVTLMNVNFSNDRAVGGAGSGGGGTFEGNLGPYGSDGGGGGLGGDGGTYGLNGGGGGGIGGAGGTASAGAAGIVLGAAGGGSGSSGGALPPFAGGPNGGGGGSTPYGSFAAGGGGGVGGGSALGTIINNDRVGGTGGFGGGGGGGSGRTGGQGGFGGGGGSSGGSGGFGGGGADESQSGGFGAGAGSTATDSNMVFPFYDGGGGLGAGGAVFVQAGATLTMAGGSITGGSVVGGAGGTGYQEGPAPAVRNGQGLGSGIFLQGNQTLSFVEALGQNAVIGDVIADQSGAGGIGINAGAGTVSIVGPGSVELTATNIYSGGTSITGGNLELAALGAAGSGAISFLSDLGATLRLDAAALPNGTTFTNPIAGFAGAHLLDLRGLAFGADTTAVLSGNTLTASSNGITDRFTVNASYGTPITATTSNDGSGGTLVSALPANGGTDVIRLAVSEDAFGGDAQYTVSVDGSQVGGVRTATALHSAGASQDVTITGAFGPGAHSIGITFINDAYAGTPQTDRNLYVDTLSFNGQSATPTSAALYSAGTMAFDVPPATTATRLTLLLAEDPYKGDAQYSVTVDGQSVAPTGTVTATNASGQTQAVNVYATLTAGTHDLALSFLNDAYDGTPATDRNLFLKDLQVNGTSVPGGTANFYSASTEHFSIIVPPV